MEEDLQKLIPIGVLILLALLALNFFTVSGIKADMAGKLVDIKELVKPANIELISIKSGCDDCFSTDEILSNIRESNLNILKDTTLNADSQEAKALIADYAIGRLPAVIINGDINKTAIADFEQRSDALVFDSAEPPYVDPTTGNTVGKVSVTIIADATCEDCPNAISIVQVLQQSGVLFSDVKQVDISSLEGEQLITQYGIERLPALLFSKVDMDAYPIASQLTQSGFMVLGDYYVLETQAPPYVEVETGNVRGLTTLTLLNDSSCIECYDVRVHTQVLAQFGIAISKENVIDVNSAEGLALVAQYNITKVPTMLISGDVAIYEDLTQVWSQVGTIEEDGTYVFREIEALGQGIEYKEL